MDYDKDNKNIEPKKTIVTNQFQKKNNVLALASLVLGIISFTLCWAFILPIIIGIISIITGCISLAKKCDDSKIAIAGIVLSIIGLLLNILISAQYIIGMFTNQ